MKNSFISLVVDGLIREAGGIENLGKYTLVFPMHRAGLFLKEELKKRMVDADLQHPVLSPEITTLDGLVSHLTALQPADEIASVVALYHIYKAQLENRLTLIEPMTLDVFYGWGRQLIQDFDNADMAMIPGGTEVLFSHSVEAHELEKFLLDDDTLSRLKSLFGQSAEAKDSDSKRKQFEQLWEVLPAIYREFRKSQNLSGVGSRGAMICDAIRVLQDESARTKALEHISGRTVVFIGFNYLLGAERLLMQTLRELIPTLFFWDYREDFRTNSKAYAYLKANVEEFGNHLPLDGSSALQPCCVTAVSSVTANAQAQYVHTWLSEHREGKTAIVIADESMLEPVLYALPKEVSGRVNITKGYPLRNTKVFAEVMHFLQDHDREMDVRMRRKPLAEVLDQLTAHIESKAAAAHRWNELHAAADNVAVADSSDAADENSVAPVSWDFSLLMESYYQARTVISRFTSLLRSGLLQDIEELPMLRHLIAQHMSQVSMPFHGEPVTDIQVIGVLETRLLDFDNLLILNAEEGIVPRTPNDNSFIPYYLRKYYGMQTSDEETAIYAYNFFRLFRRCSNPTVVYCNAVADSSQKGMSRFVMQMMISPEFEVEKKWISEQGMVTQKELNVVNPITFIDCLKARDLKAQQQGKVPARWKLSPSAINTYLECPRRFYYENICDLRPEEVSGALLQANEMGSLIHAILQIASEKICGMPADKALLQTYPMPKEKIEAFMQSDYWKNSFADTNADSLLNDAYAALNEEYWRHHHSKDEAPAERKPFYVRGEHRVENSVAMANAEKVLKNDMSAQGLALVEQENDRRAEMHVSLSDSENYTIYVGGKIDRLDVIEENGVPYLRILDYKTGSYNEAKMKAESLAAVCEKGGYMLQTLLYCLACSESDDIQKFVDDRGLKIKPGLLFTRMGLDSFDPHLRLVSGSGKSKEANPILDFSLLKEDFRNEVLNLLQNKLLVDCEWNKCEEKNCSKSCPFHLLCGREVKPDFNK